MKLPSFIIVTDQNDIRVRIKVDSIELYRVNVGNPTTEMILKSGTVLIIKETVQELDKALFRFVADIKVEAAKQDVVVK